MTGSAHVKRSVTDQGDDLSEAMEKKIPTFTRMTRPVRRNAHWWLLGSIAALGLIAVIAGAWFAHGNDDWSDKLWLEVAKAGVAVLAVGVLGGALSNLWKNISARRTAEDERNEKIRAELVSLFSLYNDVKAIRRTLRSLGLDLVKYPPGVPKNDVLSEEQARGFHDQMLVLNGLQLGFEAKAKQFGQTDFLEEDTAEVVQLIGDVEDYLNQVLALWEERGWTIKKGTSLDEVSKGLTKLFRVNDNFGRHVSEPLHDVTRLINKHIFGEAKIGTQVALKKITDEHNKRDCPNTSVPNGRDSSVPKTT